MAHRSHEWPQTARQLGIAFADPAFALHPPVPAPFGDEGAANHMRLSSSHDAPGVEIFVFGRSGGPYPVRQHLAASQAVARAHGVERSLFAEQSEAAIAAGAFHNDVVAVANGPVLFAHEEAFASKEGLYDALKALLPTVEIIEVPAAIISLADAIRTYLFNAQLVTLPTGGMALILPSEVREDAGVWRWLEGLVAGNGPIRQLVPVDLRESMANGGGPACLRLRVVADPATVDPRFLVDEGRLDRIANVVRQHWPEEIAPAQLSEASLYRELRHARAAMLEMLDLNELATA